MHLEQDDLAFLARFATSPDAESLFRLLREKLEAVHVMWRKSAGEDSVRLQGRAIELGELMDLVSGKSTKLVRSQDPRGVANLRRPSPFFDPAP